jgi:putative ABC transport system permease protein
MAEISQYSKIAFRNLKTRSLRSWLTILGILIGVFLIISLLSLSEGIKMTITKQLRSLGGEMIFIMPGDISNPVSLFIGGAKLEEEDLEAIKKTEEVDKVLTMSYQSVVARYKEEGKTVLLAGVPLEEGKEILERYQGWSLSSGRWPTTAKKEVVVGQQVVKGIFKQEIKIDSDIILKGVKFKIVGILNSLGSKMDDSFIYLDTNLYQDLTGEKKGTAQMAIVKIQDGSSLNTVADNIKENLQKIRKRRAGTDAADFSVITSERMGDIAGNIVQIIQLAVVAFAGIAIAVGGIGIMNTMFTSVRERTREIGIMKAVGAKNSAVLSIFLVESGIIGLSGGLGGTILGVIFAKLIEVYGQVHPLFYFRASVSPGLILFGLIFSFIVGCLSGFFPARKAAKLRPVEALRHYE